MTNHRDLFLTSIGLDYKKGYWGIGQHKEKEKDYSGHRFIYIFLSYKPSDFRPFSHPRDGLVTAKTH